MNLLSRINYKPKESGTVEYESRNFILALINGILIRIGFRFVDSNMVLAAFIKQLTNSNIMVGLTSSLMRAGSIWPQLIISNMIEHRPRKMPFYILGSSMRVSSWIIIVALTVAIGNKNPLLLSICFYIIYFISNSSMGISIIPFSDIIAKSIPVKRRARLFGLRQLIGGIFGIGAGFIIRYILSDKFPFSFPHNYAFMFGITAFMIICSSTSFALSKEPIKPVRDAKKSFWEHLKSGPRFLKKDPDYRNFMLFRTAQSFGSMCIPFFVPYALDQIRVSHSIIGTYTAIAATSAVLSNILWAYVGEKRSSKSLLVASTVLSCVAPLIAIFVKYLPLSQQPAFYSLVFIMTQAAINCSGLGYMTYSLNMAPSMSRPTYIGFLNTMMFPMSFVPFLAGGLLKIMSYEWLFTISAVMSITGFFFAFSLSNVDDRDDIESKDE
jgi:hypothetical protein